VKQIEKYGSSTGKTAKKVKFGECRVIDGGASGATDL